jgi:putative transcriptional regulator
MPDRPSDLEAPVLLVAMPQVLDPFFHKSVVLLIHQSEEGSFGLILNRATGIHVSEILNGMEISWTGDKEARALFGGPVQPQLGTVLYSPLADQELATEASSEILSGVLITQHVGDLGRLAGSPPAAFRLFLGYAGWGAGQLLEEILRNDWLTAPVSTDLVFAHDLDRVWSDALLSVGVDPLSLPSWTPAAGGGESAN